MLSELRATPCFGTNIHQPQIDGFEPWDQWDFGYYQKIAEFGYEARDGSLAFDPLFPCLLRLSLTSVEVILLPGLSSPESLRLLRRYCCAGWYNSIMTARYHCAVCVCGSFLFFRPYFLHVGYSESLFLALALASVLAARVDRWGLAGLLGAFCWLTRAGGAVLVPSLAVEAA